MTWGGENPDGGTAQKIDAAETLNPRKHILAPLRVTPLPPASPLPIISHTRVVSVNTQTISDARVNEWDSAEGRGRLVCCLLYLYCHLSFVFLVL